MKKFHLNQTNNIGYGQFAPLLALCTFLLRIGVNELASCNELTIALLHRGMQPFWYDLV